MSENAPPAPEKPVHTKEDVQAWTAALAVLLQREGGRVVIPFDELNQRGFLHWQCTDKGLELSWIPGRMQ